MYPPPHHARGPPPPPRPPPPHGHLRGTVFDISAGRTNKDDDASQADGCRHHSLVVPTTDLIQPCHLSPAGTPPPPDQVNKERKKKIGTGFLGGALVGLAVGGPIGLVLGAALGGGAGLASAPPPPPPRPPVPPRRPSNPTTNTTTIQPLPQDITPPSRPSNITSTARPGEMESRRGPIQIPVATPVAVGVAEGRLLELNVVSEYQPPCPAQDSFPTSQISSPPLSL